MNETKITEKLKDLNINSNSVEVVHRLELHENGSAKVSCWGAKTKCTAVRAKLKKAGIKVFNS